MRNGQGKHLLRLRLSHTNVTDGGDWFSAHQDRTRRMWHANNTETFEMKMQNNLKNMYYSQLLMNKFKLHPWLQKANWTGLDQNEPRGLGSNGMTSTSVCLLVFLFMFMIEYILCVFRLVKK